MAIATILQPSPDDKSPSEFLLEMTNRSPRPVLVLGATGYLGGRLVPHLLDQGYRVRAAGRSISKLENRPWVGNARLERVATNVFDRGSLLQACQGCSAAYYLIHSMDPEQKNFAQADREAATNMIWAAEQAGLERIIYLGGLGQEGPNLSKHLRSRAEVGQILRSGRSSVTVLRSAMILGAGSASFEILRYLVERLPVMITPRWVRTECQPIAVRNTLDYLVSCLEVPETMGQTFDIGGPGVLTYHELMRVYAEEAVLPKRWVIPVPVLTPRLSSYWIHWVTPVEASIARPLAEGLSNRVVCTENRIRQLIPQSLLSCRQAIRVTLDQPRRQLVEDDCHNHARFFLPEWSYSGDPPWAGGTVYKDHRRVTIKASPEQVWQPLLHIGGQTGWYYSNRLWRLRGFLDRLIGGVGLRRGRSSPTSLSPGDVVDSWRVARVEPRRHLRLVAEMKLPGQATLDFSIQESDGLRTTLSQVAYFVPRGLSGILYWYAVYPLHQLVFNGMLRGIVRRIAKPVIRGPQRVRS
jgi:uncharacterized protein YbjT (DUF2867 family)